MDLVEERNAQSTIRPKATMRVSIPKRINLRAREVRRISFLKEEIIQVEVQINLRIKNSQIKISPTRAAKEAESRRESFNFQFFNLLNKCFRKENLNFSF